MGNIAIGEYTYITLYTYKIPIYTSMVLNEGNSGSYFLGFPSFNHL